MQPIQRTAAQAARRLRPQLQRQQRRAASDTGHGASSDPSKGTHGQPHHASSGTESLGKPFYISISALAFGFALYKLSRQGTDEQPWLTRRFIEGYNSYKDVWARRNDVHTQMVQQAAGDRLLFLNETGAGQNRHVDVRFPEIMNQSSPWNVPAGNGSANMDAVIAKYRDEAFAQNEEKLKQVQENRVPREQPVRSLKKLTPAGLDS
ncbi:hypothetical protein MBLNU230_g5758t1 [Neophaeotheca triangularis]